MLVGLVTVAVITTTITATTATVENSVVTITLTIFVSLVDCFNAAYNFCFGMNVNNYLVGTNFCCNSSFDSDCNYFSWDSYSYCSTDYCYSIFSSDCSLP